MKEEDNHTVWLSNRDFHSKPFCFCYHLFITQANWSQAVSLIWWLEETGSPSYSYVDHALHNLRGPGSFSMLDIVVFSVFSSTPCLQNSASVFSLEFAPTSESLSWHENTQRRRRPVSLRVLPSFSGLCSPCFFPCNALASTSSPCSSIISTMGMGTRSNSKHDIHLQFRWALCTLDNALVILHVEWSFVVWNFGSWSVASLGFQIVGLKMLKVKN